MRSFRVAISDRVHDSLLSCAVENVCDCKLLTV